MGREDERYEVLKTSSFHCLSLIQPSNLFVNHTLNGAKCTTILMNTIPNPASSELFTVVAT
jgi:hypothetical protein